MLNYRARSADPLLLRYSKATLLFWRDALGRFTGMLGILAVLTAAWLGSTDRRQIRWRTVAWGLSLQFIFAFLVLRFDFGQRAMAWAGDVVNNMLSATAAGTKVLFGALGTPDTSLGSIFAFQVLPTIIFISAFLPRCRDCPKPGILPG